jgi:hypothetical protein
MYQSGGLHARELILTQRTPPSAHAPPPSQAMKAGGFERDRALSMHVTTLPRAVSSSTRHMPNSACHGQGVVGLGRGQRCNAGQSTCFRRLAHFDDATTCTIVRFLCLADKRATGARVGARAWLFGRSVTGRRART